MSDEIKKPEQVTEAISEPTPALSEPELDKVVGGTEATDKAAVSNIANMQHDMLKAVASNLRA